MSKEKWKLSIEFEVDSNWRPLETACWFNCPLSCLTHLGKVCMAKEAFDKHKIIICPIYRYGEREKNEK